jgi:threonine/homoserine/homoserine lactone efflux protein
MPLPELAAALVLLLVTPGPTNTLMALGGAERGLVGGLRLIPAEVAAYLAVTVPLALMGQAMLATLPGLGAALAGIAAVWVAVLAVMLWRIPARPDGTGGAAVTAGRVFVTTLANPKALVIGLALLPAGAGAALGPRVALFAVLIVAAAAIWVAAGVALMRAGGAGGGPMRLLALRRVAAVALGLLAAGLAAGALPA